MQARSAPSWRAHSQLLSADLREGLPLEAEHKLNIDYAKLINPKMGILPIPAIPQPLRDAAQRGTLTPAALADAGDLDQEGLGSTRASPVSTRGGQIPRL